MNSLSRSCAFLILLILLSTPVLCEAAKWEQVAIVKEGETTITGYLDKNSIEDDNSKLIPTFLVQKKIAVWEKRAFSPARVLYNRPISEILQYTKYQENKQYCVVETWTIYNDGSKLNNKEICQFTRIAPDSIEESVWRYLFVSTQPPPPPKTPPPSDPTKP